MLWHMAYASVLNAYFLMLFFLDVIESVSIPLLLTVSSFRMFHSPLCPPAPALP